MLFALKAARRAPVPRTPLTPSSIRLPRDPAMLRTGVELALVVLLAAQAARLIWLLAVPSGPIGAAAAAPAAVDAGAPALALASDPFHPGAYARPAAQAEVSGLRLHGLRVSGALGAAILSAGDGPQAAFRVGDEVAPGIVLQAVAADHALLRTAGGERRLELDAAPAPASARPVAHRPAPAPTLARAGAGAVDPAALLAQAGLSARTEGGRITGYALIPRGDGALLRQAGLAPGDVLLAVNGNPLTPERLGELESELARGGQARLTVERDGRARTLSLRTTSP